MEEAFSFVVEEDFVFGNMFFFRKGEEPCIGGPVIHQKAVGACQVVPHAFHRQVAVSVQEGRRFFDGPSSHDDVHGTGEGGNIISKVLLPCPLGGGADDEARAFSCQGGGGAPQPVSYVFVGDFLGDTDVGGACQGYGVAAGEADFFSDQGSLGFGAVFFHLHQDGSAFGAGRPFQGVPVPEEGVSSDADIDEHAGEGGHHVFDDALVHSSHNVFFPRSFHKELGKCVVVKEGKGGLVRPYVEKKLFHVNFLSVIPEIRRHLQG